MALIPQSSAGLPPAILAGAIALATGFGVWVALSLGGERIVEAWDTNAYFDVGIWVMALAVAVAGFVAPRRVWRWSLWMVAGHVLGIIAVHPPGMGLGLLPLAILIMYLPMTVLLVIPALIGGMVRVRGWDRELLA